MSSALHDRRSALSLALFALVSLAALAAAFAPLSVRQLSVAIAVSGYWITEVLLLATAAAALILAWPPRMATWRPTRETLATLGLALLATLFLATREEAGFKILFDEPVLSNIALNMHKSREAIITGSSLLSEQAAGVAGVDKRPLLFPTLLCNVHDLFGYRPANAFALNIGVTFLLLVALARIARKLTGSRHASWIAILLAAASPPLSHNANGGGFDLLNGLLLAWAVLLLHSFLAAPSARKQTLLLLLAATLASTRYESILYSIPIYLAITWVGKQSGFQHFRPGQAIVPAFYIPVAWVVRTAMMTSEHWSQAQPESGVFGLGFVADNLSQALAYFALPTTAVPNQAFVFLLGCAGLALAVAQAARKSQQAPAPPKLRGGLLFALGLALHFLLLMAYFWGDFSDPLAARLALPFYLFFLLFATKAVVEILNYSGRIAIPLGATALTATVLYSLVVYAQADYARYNKLIPALELLKEHHATRQRPNTLYITNFQSYAELYGINNISFIRANLNAPELRLHSDEVLGTYDAVYALQLGRIDLVEGEPQKTILDGYRLSEAFHAETEVESSFLAYYFVRISRIDEIQPLRKRANEFSGVTMFPVDPAKLQQWSESIP